MEKSFPEGMVPLGNSTFSFGCHPEVPCYMTCCRKLDLPLYPYDIIRLKNKLGMDSEDFMRIHTFLVSGSNPCFPTVMMKMKDDSDKTCPFLSSQGCTVYEDRPSACRTYPLERAVDRQPAKGEPAEYYFLVKHPYCLGHNEATEWTVKKWLRDQRMLEYNTLNVLWTEMDTLFAKNPWQGEGAAGPKQQAAFMVCYNIDGFRRFVEESDLLGAFKLERPRLRKIQSDDEALQNFGFDWLKFMLAGLPTLKSRK